MNARCRAGEVDVVGVDISGRHEESGEYLMVAAAVAARVDTSRLRRVEGIGLATSQREPTFRNAAAVIRDALSALPEPPAGPVVAERGEFYEEPAWTVEEHIEAEFKYVESIADRETVGVAHHAAYAARTLLLDAQIDFGASGTH